MWLVLSICEKDLELFMESISNESRTDKKNPNRKWARREIVSKVKQDILLSPSVLTELHLKHHGYFCRAQSSEKNIRNPCSGASNQEEEKKVSVRNRSNEWTVWRKRELSSGPNHYFQIFEGCFCRRCTQIVL